MDVDRANLDGKIVLYHVTYPENVKSIKRIGLMTPRSLGKRLPVRYSQPCISDSKSVYLSTKKSANIDTEMRGKDVFFVEVSLEEDDTRFFLADDDWMWSDLVESGKIDYDEWDGMSEEEKDDISSKYWKDSLADGFGIRYLGDIPPSKITGFQSVHIEKDGNVKFIDGDDDECKKFKFAFEAFEKEVKGHDIIGLLERSKQKYESIKSKSSYEASVLRKKIHDYTRYIEAYEETKKIYENICEGKKHDIKCGAIIEAHDVWHEEIHKYKVGWLKYYKKINAIYDEMISKYCDFE